MQQVPKDLQALLDDGYVDIPEHVNDEASFIAWMTS